MRIKTVEITPEVEAVLRGGSWEGTLFVLPPGQLDRKLYEAVDKVLKALGGKWNRQMRGHLFTVNGQLELSVALDEGSVVDQKRTFEQFFTPAELARDIAEMLDIKRGHHVLEPSAGGGALVQAALDRGCDIITAVEIDRALAEALPVRHGEIFAFCTDFLTWSPPSPIAIDRVIMNPPFGGGMDMVHFRRAFEFLRPGGQIACIMSPHWTFAEDRQSRSFRADMEAIGAQTEKLPEGTFKASGTGVSSILVRAWK